MQRNPQPEDFESQAAAALDAWITARLTGQEQLASLPNLSPHVVDLTALVQDLLSLAEDIQPNDEFVPHLAATLKAASLRRLIVQYHLSSSMDLAFLDTEQVEDRLRDS